MESGLFVEREKEDLSAQTGVVFDVLDSMPTFWQDTDVPVEHALTTFVAFSVSQDVYETDVSVDLTLLCVLGQNLPTPRGTTGLRGVHWIVLPGIGP